MRDWSFDPAQQAFTLESTAAIPDGGSGSVELISENPQFMSLTAKMDSAGLVVIGDRYDSGWQATVDGQPAELLCVNHVLRGIAIARGSHAIELHYIPAAFVLGVRFFFRGSHPVAHACLVLPSFVSGAPRTDVDWLCDASGAARRQAAGDL